jgi:phosphoribosylformylglycinamidine synthase
MALSKQDLETIKALLNREASIVEHHVFDTMWSEHCSYKSSKRVLKLLPTKAKSVALGIGEDAGIVRFTAHEGKQYCIVMSHESHNHPSQILPIEGAATGVGGCVRDVYCMGADVIGVLNSLHFGISDDSQSLVDEIAENVVLGIADYGNALGVPVLGGETLYHKSYNDNCLVNVAALGLITEDQIIHSYVPKQAKTEPYDIILIGKSTDATGFGGASFSSATLDNDDDVSNIGAVQVHDPFMKRVIVEGIKKCLSVVAEQNVIIGFKDLGAGGISCAGSEIAVGGGFGVRLDLDKVNVAFNNLPAEVIACSETQERFCMAVPRYFSQTVCDIFNKEYQLPLLYPQAGAVVIGEVTQEQTFIMTHKGAVVCDLPVQCITTEVRAHRESKEKIKVTPGSSISLKDGIDLKFVLEKVISQKMGASKRHIYRHFDNAVRGATVVYPGEADAVVIKPLKGSPVGLVVTMDSNLYGEADPYVAGAGAVAESIRNVVALGAKPLALTDCLNYGNPEKPSVFYDFEQGVLGIKDAAEQLSMDEGDPVPIISGNVSFYNESKHGNAVTPSPVICCIGRVDDVSTVKTAQCFEVGLELFLIGKRYPEFAGTAVQPYIKEIDLLAPQVRFEDELLQNKAILSLYEKKLVHSCHDISVGGLWQTLLEMCLGERGIFRCGITFDGTQIDSDLFVQLCSENGGFVVATDDASKTRESLSRAGVHYYHIATTTEVREFHINSHTEAIVFNLTDLEKSWNQTNS